MKPRYRELRANWRLLTGAAIGMSVGAAAIMPPSLGLFMSQLHRELGWSMTSLTTVQMVFGFLAALMTPVIGVFVDRFGTRGVTTAGFIGFAGLLFGLSLVGNSLVAYAILMCAIGVIGPATTGIVFSPVINARFDECRGLATGLLLTGIGITSAIVPVYLAWLMNIAGWRGGFQGLALIVVLAAPCALLLMGRTGKSVAELQDLKGTPTFGVVLRRPVLWALLVAFALPIFGLTGLFVHMATMLTGGGLSLSEAAYVQAAFGISIMVGRLIASAAMDHVPALRVVIISFLAAAAGLLLFAFGGPAMAIPAALLCGQATGAETGTLPYVVSRYFEPEAFGKAFGVIYMVGMVAAGTGPVMIAALSANGTDYANAMAISAALVMLAAVIFVFTPPPGPALAEQLPASA